MKALIEDVFAALTIDEVQTRLDAAGIGYGQMNDMADLWAHRQLKARDRWRQVATETGAMTALLPPGRNSAFEARMDPIPSIGEHTDLILRELGYDDAGIARLRQENAV